MINHDCLLIWARGKLDIRVNRIILGQTDDFDGFSLCRTLRVGSLVLNNAHSTGFDWGRGRRRGQIGDKQFFGDFDELDGLCFREKVTIFDFISLTSWCTASNLLFGFVVGHF
jgi:hypothetical protein